jgi:hypothetical protein
LGFGGKELEGAPAVRKGDEDSLTRSFVFFSASDRLLEEEVIYCTPRLTVFSLKL